VVGNKLDAVTLDVSASGLFLEADSEQWVGNLIDVEIDLDTSSGPIKFKVQGKIVRIASSGCRRRTVEQLTGAGEFKCLTNRLPLATLLVEF